MCRISSCKEVLQLACLQKVAGSSHVPMHVWTTIWRTCTGLVRYVSSCNVLVVSYWQVISHASLNLWWVSVWNGVIILLSRYWCLWPRGWKKFTHHWLFPCRMTNQSRVRHWCQTANTFYLLLTIWYQCFTWRADAKWNHSKVFINISIQFLVCLILLYRLF